MRKLLDLFKDLPPLWEPPKKGKYQHRLTLSHPILNFTSEKKLREVERVIKANVEYPPVMDKRKIAVSKDENGFIEL